MNKMDQAITHYSKWVIKYKYIVLIISLLIAFGIGSGGRFLAFTSSYKVFFGKTNPFLESFETMQKIYSKSDSVLFVLAPKDGQVFTPSFLSALEELTQDTWQTPHSYRVDSLSNYQHIEADEEGLLVGDLYEDAESLSPQEIERIKEIAVNEPLLVNRLITNKANVTAVNVSVRLEDGNDQAVFDIAKFSRQLKADFEKRHPEIDVYLTGLAMLSNAFPEVSMKDMSVLIPAMYGIILVLSFLVLRSFGATFATLLVIMLSTMVAMGFAGYLGLKLTPVNANVPMIVLTLAVADSIHVLLTFLHLMRKGETRYDALTESLRVNFIPVIITSVTTAIGFLGLNFSDAPPFHDLGNMTAVGVMAALFFSLFLLPAMMAILPIKVKVKASDKKPSKFSIDALSDWVILHRGKLLWGTVGLSLLMASMLPKLYINDSFVDYFAKGFEIRDSTDFATQNITGIYTMEFSLNSGEAEGISNPQYLEKIDEFALWLRDQPGVKNVNVITDILKRLNKSMHEDDPEWYKLPDQSDLAAQYLLLYEMSLPLGLDLNNQINVDKSATKMTVTLGDLGTLELQNMKERSEAWLRANAPANMHSEASSASLMFTYITLANAKGMLIGTGLSLIFITITLIFAFRSLKYGLLSLIPNVLPIVMTFGIWSIIDGEIGVAAATVATMTLGIIVDDTVHFISKYMRAKEEQNLSSADAVRYSFSTVGVALFATSVILVCGFGILTTSVFKMNEQMGMFTVMTVIIALVIDFLFLPTLLMKLDGKKESEEVLMPLPLQSKSA